jgi:hypothetical protein
VVRAKVATRRLRRLLRTQTKLRVERTEQRIRT